MSASSGTSLTSAFPTLSSPLHVGPLTLRGRLYLPAHQPGLARGGRPTPEYIEYHRARARAGAAMQVTGATPVAPSAEWADICLWNIDDSIVPGYRELAAAVHGEGGRMIAQLAHPGPTEFEGRDVFGPSLDFSEVSQQVSVPATAEQLGVVVDQYAAAAARCADGDLDGVELSMAHGLLLAAFLTPLLNHRDDEFGGDFERRLELPRRVIRACRERLRPDMVLGIRLGADDLVPGGMSPDLAAEIATALEDEIDYISVMVGNNNRLEARTKHWPPTPAAPGLFRSVSRAVGKRVSKPVAIVGRILDAELAADIIDSGDADMVGMVRAQIAEPRLIGLSLAGRANEIRPCVGANVCVESLLDERPLRCMVNPDVRDSRVLSDLPSLAGLSAIVLGAGVAGLESARRLAARGARVRVLERERHVGGAMLSWTATRSRQEFRRILPWLVSELESAGVDLRFGVDADADVLLRELGESGADLLVVATGARLVSRDLPGDGSVARLDLGTTACAEAGEGELDLSGERILIHDAMGHLRPLWVAEAIRALGGEPVISTGRLHLGEGEGITNLYSGLRTAAEAGVEVIPQVTAVAATNGAVRLDGVFGGASSVVAADRYISLDLYEPVVPAGLADLVASTGVEVLRVGDAVRPRDLTEAFADARDLADSVLPGSPAVASTEPPTTTSRSATERALP